MSLWSRLERRIGDLAGELVLDEYRDQLNQARQLLASGDVAAAIDSLEALLRAKPEHGQALILLGEARLALREPQAAHDAFERALKLRGGDPAALVGLGQALVALGSYAPAISVLGRAVAEAGGDRGILADAYRGLGLAWRRRGDLDKAIRELRKAVVEDPDDTDARAALGEALMSDGGPYDEALRRLERAGDQALALYALGRLALVEGAPSSAAERLEKAHAAAEGDATPLGTQLRADILIALGDAALAKNDAMRAHGFYLEALQLDAKRAELHAKIASAHRAIGNLDSALASFDRIYWIAGGRPKEGGITTLGDYFPKIAKAYLIGEAATDFANTLGARVPHDIAVTLPLAVASAARDAANDGAGEPVVLLSPACASYDQFQNFERRGDAFRALVLSLDGITRRGEAA